MNAVPNEQEWMPAMWSSGTGRDKCETCYAEGVCYMQSGMFNSCSGPFKNEEAYLETIRKVAAAGKA